MSLVFTSTPSLLNLLFNVHVCSRLNTSNWRHQTLILWHINVNICDVRGTIFKITFTWNITSPVQTCFFVRGRKLKLLVVFCTICLVYNVNMRWFCTWKVPLLRKAFKSFILSCHDQMKAWQQKDNMVMRCMSRGWSYLRVHVHQYVYGQVLFFVQANRQMFWVLEKVNRIGLFFNLYFSSWTC